jgi:hypothetical protein
MVDGFDHQFRDLRRAQVNRSDPCLVQEPIHGNESLSRGEFRGKTAISRKTASETPSEKEGLANGVEMG